MKLNKVINLQNKEAMTKTITFNELRRLKDSLPDGSTHRIADELGISVETVRNYFGLGIILKMAKVVEYILNRDQTEAW